MQRKYKLLLAALILGAIALLGIDKFGKKIYRYFYPRPPVPCCVKSPNAPCCVKDTLTAEGEQFALQYLGFDVHRFMQLSNSLLTTIEHTPIHLTCNPSRRRKTKGTEYNFNFDLGKGHRILNFSLSISLYYDADGMEEDFKTLRQNGQKDMGLTYGNDDIWKVGNRIIWLHLGCPYASFNREAIIRFVRESTEMKVVTGGITCTCGGSCD